MDKKYYIENYGEEYAKLLENFLEHNPHSSAIATVKCFLPDNEKLFKPKLIDDLAKLDREYDYFSGLRDGVRFHDELVKSKPSLMNTCKYVMDKDLTIMLNFGDNDFGQVILDGAKHYVGRYKSLLGQISTYSKIPEAEHMTNDYKKRLEAMEDTEYLAKFITKSFMAEYMLTDLSNGNIDMNSEDKVEDYLDYLELNDPSRYRKGTYAEIENYVMEEFKGMQSKEDGEGQSLKTCWLNGEVLFISVKNGEIKTWVQ